MFFLAVRLYLIEILHQTTTRVTTKWRSCTLYLIEILHQTTTSFYCGWFSQRCILSKFYIKPQPYRYCACWLHVVSYRNSTSNHNAKGDLTNSKSLYLIEILHQTTTFLDVSRLNCQLYLIEILHQTTTFLRRSSPQLWLYLIEILHQTTTRPCKGVVGGRLYLIEILHQTTTSSPIWIRNRRLYLIEILHQTTTLRLFAVGCFCCILSKFYIKPQQSKWCAFLSLRCILSKFYIKPQLCESPWIAEGVVSYRNSTSNHNFIFLLYICAVVVSYRNSTSNHNSA